MFGISVWHRHWRLASALRVDVGVDIGYWHLALAFRVDIGVNIGVYIGGSVTLAFL